MEKTEMIDKLNDLIQLDVDAVEAYQQVIKHISYADIEKRMCGFQEDHRAHITNLTAIVQQMGGRPVKPTPDLKGVLIEGFTALMSLTGAKQALEAMKSNEKLTNRKYQEAVAQAFPEEVMEVLRTNLSQEQRHLSYIEEILSTPRRVL
ncbi:ferritin-like domain-containing protein [Geomonas propionica]|uniref:Ferritin-like domain-containing protein n=1 Tax=Geomonas propionica TaxID=2798582 RepID=A0ABS0YUQ0_9BACT|nr:ferritin-like domain-containing protein [Geomonas propionica]MBJ6801654.1 ferritin-like domain-containing protein [Geomonas propionica]